MADADPWRDVEGAVARCGSMLHAVTSRDDTVPAMARRTLADAPAALVETIVAWMGRLAASRGGHPIQRRAPCRQPVRIHTALTFR